jgi:predicted metalloenzyme YecM
VSEGKMLAVTDPVADVIGDYRGFAAQQRDRLLALGIDVSPYALSHIAFRVPEWDWYVHLRTQLERYASANLESVWNGRPISKIIFDPPLEVLDGKQVPMIELLPPVHQSVYKMGLEHLGVVVGESVDEFSRVHRAAITGRQFQSPSNEPYYILFEDFTNVKLYRRSLKDAIEMEGGRFEGFVHVDDWVPQRLVTATGANPLPR